MTTRRQLWVSALIAVVFVLGFLLASALFPGGAVH